MADDRPSCDRRASMIKRIILEELSGLRRIGGILDVPDGHELPKHVEWNGLTCQWVSTGPRAITYREFDPSIHPEKPDVGM